MSKRPLGELKSRHFLLAGALAPGSVVGDGAVVREVVPVAGSLRARVRAKLSANDGDVAFYFKRPREDGTFAEDGSDRHATQNPTALSLPDTNEAYREIELWGEAVLEIEYTDAGGGSTIEYVAVSLL